MKEKDIKEPFKTKFQKFQIVEIERSQIKNAPYNPRTLTEDAKSRLRKIIKKHGLIQPIIVNKTTMHIVGGHQRLEQLDSLEKSENYLLDVAMVDMTEKQEKEANLALNNAMAMGDWDEKKLSEMIQDLDLDSTGFDVDSLNILGIDYVINFPEDNETTKEYIEDINNLSKSVRGSQENEDVKLEKESPDFFLSIVFMSTEEKKEFLKSIKLDQYTKYIDARLIKSMVLDNRKGK